MFNMYILIIHNYIYLIAIIICGMLYLIYIKILYIYINI